MSSAKHAHIAARRPPPAARRSTSAGNSPTVVSGTAVGSDGEPNWIDTLMPRLRHIRADRLDALKRGDDARADALRDEEVRLQDAIAAAPYEGLRSCAAIAEALAGEVDPASFMPCDEPLMVALIRHVEIAAAAEIERDLRFALGVWVTPPNVEIYVFERPVEALEPILPNQPM